jgi:hypothetical protein
MSILISAGKNYYLIPDDVLKTCKVTKKEFQKAAGEVEADVAGQSSDCNLVDLRSCCMSKKSYWASC